MDKLAQVLGILRALRSIATQANYTDVYKGIEAQCISTYRKCVAILKSVKDYEDIENIAPELTDSASMQEIGFAVELLLSIVRSEESAPGFSFAVGAPRLPRMPRPPRMPRRGPGRMMIQAIHRGGHERHGKRIIEFELHDEMREKIEEERERFEEQIADIEDEIEQLQDKMEEARERLEERLEEIREKYEEKIAELEEDEDHEDEDEDEDEDDDEPRS